MNELGKSANSDTVIVSTKGSNGRIEPVTNLK